MNRKWFRWYVAGLVSLLACLLASGMILADDAAEARALSIIIEETKPSEGEGFEVELWTDKGCGASYNTGETVDLFVRSAQAGYLTIYDFTPEGSVIRIFPNYYHTDNWVEANVVYQIPGTQGGYNFVVNPPYGMDILKAVVTNRSGIAPAGKADASNPFPVLSIEPLEFIEELGLVIRPYIREWGTGTCVYYVGTTLGSVEVNSTPQGADVYWDGAYYWRTPVTIYAQTGGLHTLTLRKEGYQDWTQQVLVTGGKLSTASVTLESLGLGWEIRPQWSAPSGSVGSVWASAFNGFGAILEDGWYWLRDASFQTALGWRFPVDVGLVRAGEAWLNLAALVTNDLNGGQGYETTIQLSVSARDAQGNLLSQISHAVYLSNPFRPKSPFNSNGEGYAANGLVPLDSRWVSSLPIGGTLEIVAIRLVTSFDGVYQPHVALSPDCLVLRYR